MGSRQGLSWFTRLGAQLALMCAVFSVGILLLLNTLFHEKSVAIEFATRELAGTQAIRKLNALDQNIDQYASRNAPKNPNTQVIQNLQAFERDPFLNSEHMREVAEVKAIGPKIRALIDDSTSEVSRRRLYEECLGLVNVLTKEIGDRSNLILDPDLDSYYSMSLLILNFPKQQSILNRITPQNRQDSLVVLAQTLQDQKTSLQTILRTNPALESSAQVRVLQVHESNLEVLLAREATTIPKVHSSLHEARGATASLLSDLLARRIQKFEQDRMLAVATGLGAWLVAIIFCILFTRRIVSHATEIALQLENLQQKDITELNTAILKLAEGDTTYPLEPNASTDHLYQEALSRDELGHMARCLNQLATQTERAMSSMVIAQAGVDEARRKVQKSEEQFRSMIEGLGEGIVITDLSGNVLYANKRLLQMLQLQTEEIYGKPLDEVLGTGVWFHFDTNSEDGTKIPSRNIEAEIVTSRSRFHADLILSPLESGTGGVEGCICAVLDITERKLFEDQLRHQALHDSLTGLPNRALFTDRVTQAIERHRETEKKFALIFIDLDNFKVVNDSLGHAAGDVLLNTVAKRLQQCVRGGDTVARLGGDEFTILLERLSDDSEVMQILGRIQKFFASPIKIGEQEVQVGGSLGVAFSSEVTDDAGELLRFADIAMYQAKAMGKHRHVIFDEAMREQAELRLSLERELRQALQEDGLDVYFQPIVDSGSSALTEVEALARWNSPTRGMIPPSAFIPIAEESGLINELGAYVLRRACRFGAKCLQSGNEIIVGVNLSASQLLDPSLITFVASVLTETGLPSRCLKLEITESMVMEDPKSSIEKLKQLKVLGIRLAMDDFGTGYSSMAQLKQMPIDTLKIDREFVTKLNDSNEDQAIVQAIINMAQALHLSVTCEGIESIDQAEILESMGCQRLQGFFFDKPVKEEELWSRYFEAERRAA